MIIEKTDFWSSNYYNNPILTESLITQAESKLGLKLPESYLKLLHIQNGGYTKGFAFPMTVKTSWSENHVPFTELFGIVLDEKSDSAHNIMQSEYLTEEWGLPENQILLTGEGHWWITLDYRNGDVPSVRWIDCESEEDIHIADSFSEFIDGLINKVDILK